MPTANTPRIPASFSLSEEEVTLLDGLNVDFKLARTRVLGLGIRLADELLRSGRIENRTAMQKLVMRPLGRPPVKAER